MSVEIVCPQCGFSKSLPEERIPPSVKWANCPRCKNRFELNLQKPVGGALATVQDAAREEQRAGRTAPHWERLAELGLWRAVLHTVKAVLFSPKGFFLVMHVKAGVKEPFAFGLLTGSLGTMAGLFWQFLFMAGSFHHMTQGYFSRFGTALVFAGILVLSVLFTIVSLVVTSLIIHGCLFLVGGGRNGFEATFRVVAYSQATQILAFVPFLGGVAALVWQLIVQMIGLREIHEISYARIILAFLIPFVLLLVVLVALIVTLPLLLTGR